MKFCVCIKQVLDVTAPIQVRDGALLFDAGRTVLNAYDASAVEAALVLVEQHGGDIDLVLVGPERAAETIRKGLAMGADRGAHLVVPDNASLDSAGVASLLASHLKDGGYDVILTGKQSQDTDAGQAGGILAEHLGLPFVTNAVELVRDGDSLVVTRQGDDGQESVEMPTPCVIACSNDMNDPRIPNLKGIMGAKRKPIESQPVADPPPPAVVVESYEQLPSREPGIVLDGEPADAVSDLVGRLHAANVLG